MNNSSRGRVHQTFICTSKFYIARPILHSFKIFLHCGKFIEKRPKTRIIVDFRQDSISAANRPGATITNKGPTSPGR
jgi:hypothetical protein